MANYSTSIIFLLSIVLLGCSGDSDGQSSDGSAIGAEEFDSFGICNMLTNEQVATVLPGHDGGEVAHSGGSMMEGIDSYQCSYTSEADGQYRVFTLVVSVASTPELFSRIRPSGILFGQDDRLDIADGAFIKDVMEGELDIGVIKGLNKIELDLLTEDAHERRQEMIELASLVAEKL